MAKKATFAAVSFTNLRAAAGEGAGEPLRIPLVDIDVDPNQPRKRITAESLATMVESIRTQGLLQPVGVHPPVDGRYKLVFGERRVRASKLAGQADIPAIIVGERQRDFVAQVVENQHRENLTASELAAAVNQLAAEKRTGKEIAAICAIKDYEVAYYRAVEKFPDFLLERLDTADVRALYELYRARQKHPEVEALTRAADPDATLTVAEARRIIAAAAGKPAADPAPVPDRAADASVPHAPQNPPAPASAAVHPQADDLHIANPAVPGAVRKEEESDPSADQDEGTASPPRVAPVAAPAPASAAQAPQASAPEGHAGPGTRRSQRSAGLPDLIDRMAAWLTDVRESRINLRHPPEQARVEALVEEAMTALDVERRR